jgi:hypothetical protein
MSTTILDSEAVDLLASSSVTTAGAIRIPFRIESGMGGVLTAKITNGGTGPTTQCILTLYVAHTDGTLPSGGAEGIVWKKWYELGGGGNTNSAITKFSYEVPTGPRNWQLEFSAPVGSAVTGEAQLTRVTGAETT